MLVPMRVGAGERDRSRSDAVVGMSMSMGVHVVLPGRPAVGMEVEILDWQVGRAGLFGAALTSGGKLAVELALYAAVARVASEALQGAC